MSHKILLVDDSVTVQKIITLTFSDEGVDVVTVDSGDEAISRLHYMRPALVMADVTIPGRNGYDICAHIKGSAELRHIPVILLVPGFEVVDEARARAVGADHYLTKPFQSIRSLITTVKNLIEDRQSGRLAGNVGEAGLAAAPPQPGGDLPASVPQTEEILSVAAAERVEAESGVAGVEVVTAFEGQSEVVQNGALTIPREVIDEIVERVAAQVTASLIERLGGRIADYSAVPEPEAGEVEQYDEADELLEL